MKRGIADWERISIKRGKGVYTERWEVKSGNYLVTSQCAGSRT